MFGHQACTALARNRASEPPSAISRGQTPPQWSRSCRWRVVFCRSEIGQNVTPAIQVGHNGIAPPGARVSFAGMSRKASCARNPLMQNDSPLEKLEIGLLGTAPVGRALACCVRSLSFLLTCPGPCSRRHQPKGRGSVRSQLPASFGSSAAPPPRSSRPERPRAHDVQFMRSGATGGTGLIARRLSGTGGAARAWSGNERCGDSFLNVLKSAH
jgi:hypothetical protein